MSIYTRTSRITGTPLSVGTPDDFALDGHGWVTSCDTHGTFAVSDTKQLAMKTSGLDFCDDCRTAHETVEPETSTEYTEHPDGFYYEVNDLNEADFGPYETLEDCTQGIMYGVLNGMARNSGRIPNGLDRDDFVIFEVRDGIRNGRSRLSNAEWSMVDGPAFVLFGDEWRRNAGDAALECAAWTATDENGDTLEDSEWTPAAERELRNMVNHFIGFLPLHLMVFVAEQMSAAQFGHDFVLTAQGHGAGFWDRGYGKPGDELSTLARTYSVEVYADDEGRLHIS